MSTALRTLPVGTIGLRNRRHDSDFLRLVGVVMNFAEAMNSGEITFREFRVWSYLVIECICRPMMDGESDKMRTVAYDVSNIAGEIGMDRAATSRAIRKLIEFGFVRDNVGKTGGRTLNPSGARIREIADQLARELLKPRIADNGGDGEDGPVSIRHAPRVDPTRQPVSIRHGAPTIEERARIPDSGRGNSGYISPEGLPETPAKTDQEDIYINQASNHPDSPPDQQPVIPTLKAVPLDQEESPGRDASKQSSNLTDDEERRLIDWCETHIPMRGLLERLLAETRRRYEYSWYLKALRRTKARNKPQWSYTRSILETWTAIGAPDVGPEDDYDEDMVPLPVVRMSGLATPSPRKDPYPHPPRVKSDGPDPYANYKWSPPKQRR